MMEAAVGEGSAKAFVKEEEQQGDVNAFRGDPVGVVFGVAFEESMTFQAPRRARRPTASGDRPPKPLSRTIPEALDRARSHLQIRIPRTTV